MRKAWLSLSILTLFGVAIVGCPNPTSTNTGTDNTNDTTNNDGTNTGNSDSTGTGSVVDDALSFLGSLNGTVFTSSDTGATSSGAARKRATALSESSVGWLEDLEGNRLLDDAGNEYPEFDVALNGSFTVPNVPVGVDFKVVIDVDGDGDGDMFCIVNVAQGADGPAATEDVIVDPLSTLVVQKIKALLQSYTLNPEDFDQSLSALIGRIRDAFENLYSDSGIESEITLDDILNLSDEDLAALFDELIPDSARRGMDMCVGNILLQKADTVDKVVAAAAQILVQGGFTVIDEAGGTDMTFLANLPGVESLTFGQYKDEQSQSEGEFGRESAFDFPGFTVYRSVRAELDRNFANHEGGKDDKGHGPVFGEHVLSSMAQFYLDNKVVSLGQLHRIVVDLNYGMGARFTYSLPGGMNQPPRDVFTTADGTGIAVSLIEFYQQLNDLGLNSPDPAAFDAAKAALRQLMLDFLANTAEPSFDEAFNGILTDRVGSFDEFAFFIRDQRAHLPFSRSGPAEFYVLATADYWQDPNGAEPVTVDVLVDTDGYPTQVNYNPTGAGRFYMNFGPQSDGGMWTQFINRFTGRPLRMFDGQMPEVNIGDESIFQPVNGVSFYEAFSQTGSFYPAGPGVSVPNPFFDPNEPADPQANPPTFQLFVIMDQPGPDGVPVRVDYADGVATYSETGQFYLMLTRDEGVFELIDDQGQLQLNDPGDPESRVTVLAGEVAGIELMPEVWTNIYGVPAPNPAYDPTGAPYYDDINGDGIYNAGEPLFDSRAFLNNPEDWRSTRIDYYYRRADNNTAPMQDEIDWASQTPKTLDGVELVRRNLRPNLNAFRFGTPNVTLNLLAAFSPADFFDGTQALDETTTVNPFQALAILNLVFSSVHNVDAFIDFDGDGPAEGHIELVNTHLFVPPIGDPISLILDGFEFFSTVSVSTDGGPSADGATNISE